MKPSEISSLINSPSWIATLIKYLISGAQQINPNGLGFELIFLAVPFLMNEEIVEKLSHGNKSSNLSKIFSDRDLLGSFSCVKDSIDYYNPIIKKAIIILSNDEKMYFGEKLSLEKPMDNFKEVNDSYILKYCKASYNFGIIISKEDPTEIIIRFGV